jgi:L,D-peptidoglycan transpeptidase YkuD (ErfK/YbiS/YcfS/YnhG family)
MPNFKQTYGSHWWVDVKYIPAFNPVQKQMWDLVFLQAESMHAVR